ncbi:alpha/beta hydrolase [Candidatus Woesebacteria bacterium]|nr:alpha/beta hydrolase [Candidatus Woesebacteria bacterium]MCD8507589.1 alpha/beta hydrolase [Candidatus Woesebacteria bacterium]MCD8527432.1 alpha/beta hydrolase [Candidatus Woesebacteria bacterium]MCD8546175.1 alpha/beta hydrolase [Candidatus Woesebacteria bacterium]
MPTCRTGHLQIHYQDIGKKDAPVLLLLHGWGHNWETWAPYIPMLSRSYRVVIPDLPGFGQSDGSFSGWDMWQWSIWLEDFLQRCGITQLHAVIGHSFGGKLFSFAWFAYGDELSLPPVTAGFFAIAPSGIVRPLSWPKRALRTALGYIPYAMKRRVLGRLRAFLYSSVIQETDYLNATPFQEESLRRFLSQDITEAVSEPRPFPLHFAWGSHDQAVDLWMAYRFRTIAKENDVFVVPGGDHFIHLTHPTDIQRWLETSL